MEPLNNIPQINPAIEWNQVKTKIQKKVNSLIKFFQNHPEKNIFQSNLESLQMIQKTLEEATDQKVISIAVKLINSIHYSWSKKLDPIFPKNYNLNIEIAAFPHPNTQQVANNVAREFLLQAKWIQKIENYYLKQKTFKSELEDFSGVVRQFSNDILNSYSTSKEERKERQEVLKKDLNSLKKCITNFHSNPQFWVYFDELNKIFNQFNLINPDEIDHQTCFSLTHQAEKKLEEITKYFTEIELNIEHLKFTNEVFQLSSTIESLNENRLAFKLIYYQFFGYYVANFHYDLTIFHPTIDEDLAIPFSLQNLHKLKEYFLTFPSTKTHDLNTWKVYLNKIFSENEGELYFAIILDNLATLYNPQDYGKFLGLLKQYYFSAKELQKKKLFFALINPKNFLAAHKPKQLYFFTDMVFRDLIKNKYYLQYNENELFDIAKFVINTNTKNVDYACKIVLSHNYSIPIQISRIGKLIEKYPQHEKTIFETIVQLPPLNGSVSEKVVELYEEIDKYIALHPNPSIYLLSYIEYLSTNNIGRPDLVAKNLILFRSLPYDIFEHKINTVMELIHLFKRQPHHIQTLLEHPSIVKEYIQRSFIACSKTGEINFAMLDRVLALTAALNSEELSNLATSYFILLVKIFPSETNLIARNFALHRTIFSTKSLIRYIQQHLQTLPSVKESLDQFENILILLNTLSLEGWKIKLPRFSLTTWISTYLADKGAVFTIEERTRINEILTKYQYILEKDSEEFLDIDMRSAKRKTNDRDSDSNNKNNDRFKELK